MSEKTQIWIVNILTGSRIIGTILLPLIVTLLNPLGIAFYIGVLWCTDLIDGVLARYWEVSTIFGAIFDTLSDKLFQFATFLYLATFTPLMYLLFGLEIATMVSNTIYGYKGADVKSSKKGKCKTAILTISTILTILSTISTNTILNAIIPYILGISIITQIRTLKDYIYQNRNYLIKNPPKKRKHKRLKKWKSLKEVLFSPSYHKEHINEPLLDKLAQEEIIEIDTINAIKTNSSKRESQIFKNEDINELIIKYQLNNNEIKQLETFCIKHNITIVEIKKYLAMYIDSLPTNQNISLEEFICKEHQKTINLINNHKNVDKS